eukprot:SAG31_NODE_7720_length_1609_cov_1.274172_2_plen_122_part_00
MAALHPFGMVLPSKILGLVASEPSSELAADYRQFVRCVHVAQMRRVSDILVAHSAVIENPPKAWLEQRFPEENWSAKSNGMYGLEMTSCANLWQPILEDWDQGKGCCFLVLVPTIRGNAGL